MSTTEKTVRVGITFNAEIHPEWFDLLSRVTSGRARAEIVRAHLSLPTERYLSKFSNSPVILEPLRKTFTKVSPPLSPTLQRTADSGSVDLKTPTVPDSPSPDVEFPIVNSAEKTTGMTGSFTSILGEKKREVQDANTSFPEKTDSDATVSATVSARPQGMASMLLSQGFNNIGEN